MNKKFLVPIVVLFLILFFSFWSVVSNGYDRQNSKILIIKKIIPPHLARKVRDTFFIIPNLKNENKILTTQIKKYEQGYDGSIFSKENLESKNKKYNLNLKKFFLPFKRLDINLGWQANKNLKRAHYLEIIDDKVLVISGEGETIYFNKTNINKNKLNQKKIPNDIELILDQKKAELFAIRDLHYEDNFIYISLVEKNQKGFTINIYRAEKNFNKLNFKIFFETQEYSAKYSLQTGGRIETFKNNKILFAVGFFGKHEAAQDTSSLLGKIIAIDKNKKDYELLSFGHRNPQGLYYLKNSDIIINSEHGPKGGDEVNINFLNKNSPKNFGWPVSSDGDPYPGTEHIFKKNGWLKKTHKENNFIEPIKYFKPSIGISEITYVKNLKDANGRIFVSSLRASSIYILEIDKSMKKIANTDRVYFETNRIRDLKYDSENNVFLILFENTPAIGVLKIN